MSRLWLLDRTGSVGYDEYDSAVVCADTEEEARIINPSGYYIFVDNQWKMKMKDGQIIESNDNGWVHPDKLSVTCIGEANDNVEKGEVVCSSFNAG